MGEAGQGPERSALRRHARHNSACSHPAGLTIGGNPFLVETQQAQRLPALVKRGESHGSHSSGCSRPMVIRAFQRPCPFGAINIPTKSHSCW
jgi:hypothetical protein